MAHQYNNNWAVIVSTSRFWFNYRHPSNSLSVYHAIKRLGIPDNQIILMIADDVACNPRNVEPGCVFNHYDRKVSVYDKHVEVDYRDKDVTIYSFLRVLTDRHESHIPRSKRLLSNSESNVLLYLTGHGGDGFLKFQDTDALTSQDLSDAIQQMWDKRRYKHLLFIIDTCQAQSLPDLIRSPNVISMSSSRIGESSYSHHNDEILGVPVIDRFTNHLLIFLENLNASSDTTFSDFESTWKHTNFYSTATLSWTAPLTQDIVYKMKLTDFFGRVINVYPINNISTRGINSIDMNYSTIVNKEIHIEIEYTNYPIIFVESQTENSENILIILLFSLLFYYSFCRWIRYKRNSSLFTECSNDSQCEKEQQDTQE